MLCLGVLCLGGWRFSRTFRRGDRVSSSKKDDFLGGQCGDVRFVGTADPGPGGGRRRTWDNYDFTSECIVCGKGVIVATVTVIIKGYVGTDEGTFLRDTPDMLTGITVAKGVCGMGVVDGIEAPAREWGDVYTTLPST